MSIVISLIDRPGKNTTSTSHPRRPTLERSSAARSPSRATRGAPPRTRRVAVVTGTRAEYGLLRSTLAALQKAPHTRLQLIATGMHLLDKFGRTIDHIHADGWAIDATIPMQTGDDDPADQALGLARGVAGIAEFLLHAQSDIVLVLGDRIEAFAGALAGVTTGRLVAHIHGGDVATGDFDDTLRHSITKLSHLHLTATRNAARRIIRIGESPDRVHVVGAPGIDELAAIVREYPKRKSRSGRALIIQHACGRPAEREHAVMTTLLRVVREAGLRRAIIYPNSDRGHKGIIEAIEEHQANCPKEEVEVVRSLAREAYLRQLIESDVLIGNSSSGVIEAATAGTPVVNVGSRQDGRERSGRAVLDAAETHAAIRETLEQALRLRPITGKRTVYGDGHAGERIAALLARAPLDLAFRRKRIAY